ncbi:phospholipase D-like domain-containing protein [Alicyclobacillus dauci]|uniref:phospholipase D n=1 Tax=Alicyclobacillus dauci TaxID=1475485 RepID=A0ABY6YYS6_9BACL|nr:phospholipase D-like domain-containing protein [Alicyclobacillus dauci]WAH35783.1 phospholipase D-like domain-containing protein [Alicyclobacillus dauci]
MNRLFQKRFFSRLAALSMTGLILIASSGCGLSPASLTTTSGHVLPGPVTDEDIQFVWGNDVKDAALKLIQNSRNEVYVDMYELSDPDVIKALSDARRRNVDVRVVLDETEKHSTEVGYPELRQAGVTVKQISIKRGIDHVKMIIADDGVLIGGMNFGSNSWANNDASVVISHPSNGFKSMFLWDFERANGQAAQAPTVSAPLVYDHSIQTAVLAAVQQAQHSIDMEAFDLSDRDVINALQTAVKRGTAVEILVDPTQSYNRTAVETLRNAGAMVRYYRPYSGELMHAKIIDVDHGATFIIGSANFSHQAFTYNHEADVVLHNVSKFDSSFRQDLQTGMARGSDYPVKAKSNSWE